MLVRTDDEVYRVDAVWLGPPRATFPWRARYVSYGVGLLVMMVIMAVQRRLGIGLDFFSVAWALVGTVAITRVLGKKIDYERPLGQVLGQFWAEVTGPRAGRRSAGGSVRAGHVRVRGSRGAARAARAATVESRAVEPQRASGSQRAAGAQRAPGSQWAAGSQRTAEPRRVVPPLPEPRSGGAKPVRVRKARGGGGRPSRTTVNPARTRQPEPWRRGGHRGRA